MRALQTVVLANYKRPTFDDLQHKIDNKGIEIDRRRSSLRSNWGTGAAGGQLNHGMPNIRGVKHKVDNKGTDLAKLLLPPLPLASPRRSPVKAVHKGLPYKHNQIRPRVNSWRYQCSQVEYLVILYLVCPAQPSPLIGSEATFVGNCSCGLASKRIVRQA